MFQLVPLDNVWVTANFKGTQLAHVKPGQHVRISVDAYDGKTFDGVVDSIAISTGSRQALLRWSEGRPGTSEILDLQGTLIVAPVVVPPECLEDSCKATPLL